jgi:hypothetical protein
MSSAYEDCIDDSPKYQKKLERQLENQKSNDVVTDYASVARSFPSTLENQYSLEIPMIDSDALKKWAKERGWDVKLSPENASKGSEYMPPVRFIKII